MATDDLRPARMVQAMRLGDDSLILGQRLSAWCGHAPTLEIDLALANIALDLVGQATLLLGYAGELEGAGRNADRLAFHRDVRDFRNCLLVEQPNGDFARTIARQFLFSAWQLPLFQALARSPDPRMAEIAAKAVKEVGYHVEFAGDWVVRLGDGTEDSRRRMAEGLAWCWRTTGELFAADGMQRTLATAGEAPDPAPIRAAWDARVDAVLSDAGLDRPAGTDAVRGGRDGLHGEHLGHLLAEMQVLPRTHPDATW
ncbi:ring-1,2-phenylacetyl-CoA epoxidase subunit PaaC [Sphingomonas jejuensis]|uniref:Ring-1,2-phenylacetyl-CoA epoxidase subunit PaaC n=1 Tax=Sphingomonas jejuensis TaxID=904715 RepID=A0ABX0XM41_9SPHN|nr:1,2-phenylacetyl-CoA epoxidase subunit PaaC [Sphingomonas jejuensis]NJC34436.1 ring-1,2-phenylacetyl-CoA epoxidase subunit PaaC [Sphingomonas jejuensis]